MTKKDSKERKDSKKAKKDKIKSSSSLEDKKADPSPVSNRDSTSRKKKDRKRRERTKDRKKEKRRRRRSRTRSRSRDERKRKRKKDSSNRKRDKKDRRRDRKRRRRKRDISSLSSYSQDSEDSYQKRARKRKRGDQLKKKFYRCSKTPEEDPLAKYRRQAGYTNKNAYGNNVVWDGFQWVEKGVPISTMDATQATHTRKMRKVMISNLPMYLGLREADIRSLVSEFLITNYLSDQGNTDPVLECELNASNKTAIIECSSVEEANRFSKTNSMQILGVKCKVKRLGESMYGATVDLATLLNNADTEAKASAVAHRALNMMTEEGILDIKDDPDNKLEDLELETPLTKYIKIRNLCDPEHAKMFTAREFKKILDDIIVECSNLCELVHAFIIRAHNSAIGAETGCVFLEVKDTNEARKLIEGMQNKRYEGRKFNIVCILDNTYKHHFLKLDVNNTKNLSMPQ